MPELVLNDEQAKVVSGSTEEVVIRDSHGKVLGRIPPTMPDQEAEVIREAKRRLASSQPRYTTAQVIDDLHALESK